jgi:hypothetical protein
MNLRPRGSVAAALLCASVAHAESPDALSRSIFQELIEINTTEVSRKWKCSIR